MGPGRPVSRILLYTRAKACSTSERQLFEFAEQQRIDATRCALC
jgi:hypothetical protein